MSNRLAEQIATLDGIVISGSNGANRSGGSDTWFAGQPLLPSSDGLSAVMADTDNYLVASAEYVAPDLAPNSYLADDELYAYANASSGLQGAQVVTGSNGATRSGGSDTWYANQPLMPTSEGLSALVVSGSNGANYSGGSNWFPGAPLMPSSEGLAAVALGAMRGGGQRLDNPAAVAAMIGQAAAAAPISGCNKVALAAYRGCRAAGYDHMWASQYAVRALEACGGAVQSHSRSRT